jgi:hypothetical protein
MLESHADAFVVALKCVLRAQSVRAVVLSLRADMGLWVDGACDQQKTDGCLTNQCIFGLPWRGMLHSRGMLQADSADGPIGRRSASVIERVTRNGSAFPMAEAAELTASTTPAESKDVVVCDS